MKKKSFLILILLSSCTFHFCDNYMKDNFLNQQISGRIINKYMDSNNRATEYIDVASQYQIYLDLSIHEKIFVGDSINKKSGEYKYTVYRDSQIFEFYPVCGGHIYYDK